MIFKYWSISISIQFEEYWISISISMPKKLKYQYSVSVSFLEKSVKKQANQANVKNWGELNSSFFWNWCNVNPDKITKCDQLWFRGFVSIIINPFLRVFAISAFLKVIHAPKTSHFRYPENNLPTYIFSNPCNWDFP